MELSKHIPDLKIEQVGDVFVLHVKGRLDVVSSPIVEKRILEAINEGHKHLLLEIAEVSYLSSSGMRMLLSIAKKLRTSSGKLAICNLSTNVLDVLKMAGFDHILQLFKTEEEALRYF